MPAAHLKRGLATESKNSRTLKVGIAVIASFWRALLFERPINSDNHLLAKRLLQMCGPVLFTAILLCLMISSSAFLAFQSCSKNPSSFVRHRAGALQMAVKVTVSNDEPIEDVVRRFKRACNQSGHLMEMRFKEQWETAAEKKKRKAIRSRLLNRIERTNDRYEKRSFGVSEYNS